MGLTAAITKVFVRVLTPIAIRFDGSCCGCLCPGPPPIIPRVSMAMPLPRPCGALGLGLRNDNSVGIDLTNHVGNVLRLRVLDGNHPRLGQHLNIPRTVLEIERPEQSLDRHLIGAVRLDQQRIQPGLGRNLDRTGDQGLRPVNYPTGSW